jgi:hypothetical protein
LCFPFTPKAKRSFELLVATNAAAIYFQELSLMVPSVPILEPVSVRPMLFPRVHELNKAQLIF